MSKLIPNSFQHPNFYIDKLSYFLTPQENVVLDKAIREILGWDNKIEKRQARIALSIFVDGKFNRETGERLCYGCGLGISAIRKALTALNEFGILVKVGEPCPIGQLFRLQDDIAQIDIAALELRRETQEAERKQRTAKARGVLSDNRGIVRQHDGVLSDNRAGVLSDNNKETHEKPKGNPHGEDTALEDAMGPRQHPIPQGDPVQSNGNWRERLRDNPHLTWGSESQEIQRQVERYGSSAHPILKLGYELERALGMRPAWGNRQEVKTWMSGLVECLENADHDWQLVVSVARQMREEGLSIKNPHSIKGMVADAAAKKRSKATGYQHAQQQMEDDPQREAFRQLREANE